MNDRKRYILILDQDPEDGQRTSMLLRKFGYATAVVATGQEAVDLLGSARPAGVVCDVHAEHVNLLRLIGRDERFVDIPMIALSRSPAGVAHQVQQGDYVVCLQKPLKPDALYAAVQMFIEKGPRRNIRVETSIRALAGGEGDKEGGVEGTILNISEFGLFLLVPDLLPRSIRLPLRFELLGRKIVTEVMVLHSFTKGEGPFREQGMGMKFVRIKPQDRQLIRQYIMEAVDPQGSE